MLGLLLLLVIAGAVLFGLGIYSAPIWITGVSIMALSNLTGYNFSTDNYLNF